MVEKKWKCRKEQRERDWAYIFWTCATKTKAKWVKRGKSAKWNYFIWLWLMMALITFVLCTSSFISGLVSYGFGASSKEKKSVSKIRSLYHSSMSKFWIRKSNSRVIRKSKAPNCWTEPLARKKITSTQNGNSTSKLNRKWMKVYAQKNFFLSVIASIFTLSAIHSSSNSIPFAAWSNEWHEIPTPTPLL